MIPEGRLPETSADAEMGRDRVDTVADAQPSRPGPRLWFLVAIVTAAGIALAVSAAFIPDQVDWEVILLLAAIAVLAECFDLSLYGDSRVSLAFVPIFAALILSGLTGLAVVVPLAMLASGFRRPTYKTAFNFGALMVAGGASVAVFESFGRLSNPADWPEVLAPASVAGGVNFMVNSLLVACAIALSSRTGVAAVWREHFMWLWPHYLVLGLVGLGMAAAYTSMGLWGIAVFLAPALMMRLSLKQYVDKTTQNVLELRAAHEQLQEAHAQVTAAMVSLGKAYEGTLRSLVAALDARDSETAGHSERVAELTMAIAEEMGIERESEDWRHMFWGALLHDVGKIAIADEILRKPSTLTDLEWDAMRIHPQAGHDILKVTAFLSPAAEIVLAHHERFDGGGYPLGLAGEQIPLGARIFAIADAFDAMTNDRAYRKALPMEEALAEVLRHSGSQFDPAGVRAFLNVYRKRYVAAPPVADIQATLSETLKNAILEAAGLDKGS